MEIISVDISLLLISLILATIIFVFYAFPFKLPFLECNHIETKAFGVGELICILKKVCPVNSANRWKLLSQNTSEARCWEKRIHFPGSQNDIHLYGSACAVPCSSMYAFSLIADVTKLNEWESLPVSQSLSANPFGDARLHKDKFMQADQIVGIQRGTNIQSYIAMYRFMSFSEKTVKWILFWNAKKLEFRFFLIQPAVSKTVDSQCLITHIFGTKKLSHQVISVAQRLQNVKDFLCLSQLHVIASKYTPAVPAISTSHACANKSKKSVQDERPLPVPDDSSCSRAFTLVPILSELGFARSIKGYRLTAENVKDSRESGQEKTKKKERSSRLPETKDTLKRSASDICIKAKQNKSFSSSLELRTESKARDAEDKPLEMIGFRSYIVAENLSLNVGKEHAGDASVDREQQHSSSESGAEARKIPSLSEGSEHHTDEDTFINLHIIREVSQENVSLAEDKIDIFGSSTSEFELVDTNQQFENCRLADFLTQGNYGASELQAEMLFASQFDKSLNCEAQRSSGGWFLSSSYKGITVLSKTTAGQFMKIVSYLCQIELPVYYTDVWKCVKNPRFRFISDETVKTVKIVERISNSQKLIHVYHETSGFLKKECIDFCLLQTEREEPNHFYSSFHSIEYEKCPLMTSVVRGSLRPSGWVVENLEPKRCKVTHLIQAIVSSPDSLYIQELNNLVPLAVHNLKHYTAAKPK